MFMLRSTHYLIVDTIKASAAKLIADERATIEHLRRQLADSTDRHAQTERNACDLASECNRLTAQLAERQVPAVRGSRGRFVKREG